MSSNGASTEPGDLQPATVQRAASMLLLREGTAGLEVFIQHRANTMDFAAGAVVYPGGRVDEQDAAGVDKVPQGVATSHAHLWQLTSLGDLGPEQTPFSSAVVAHAARREVWEETGLELDFTQLVPWANWVTPMGHPRRFDTFFFVAALRAGQQPRHQTTEATDSEWLAPARLLASADEGTVRLMRPTYATLQSVQRLGSLVRLKNQETPIRTVPPHRRSLARGQSPGRERQVR